MKTNIKHKDYLIGHTYLRETEACDTSIAYTYLGDKLNYLDDLVSIFYTQNKKDFDYFGLQKLFVPETMTNFLHPSNIPNNRIDKDSCIITNNPTTTIDYILNEQQSDKLFNSSVSVVTKKVFIKDKKEEPVAIRQVKNYESILKTLKGTPSFTGNALDSNILSFEDIAFAQDISVLPNHSITYNTIKFDEPPLYNSHLLINRYTPEEFYKKDILNYVFEFEKENLTLFDVLFLAHLKDYFEKDITYFLVGGETYPTYSRYVTSRNYNVDVLEGKANEYINYLDAILLRIQNILENTTINFKPLG